jgi:hypothetical protein
MSIGTDVKTSAHDHTAARTLRTLIGMRREDARRSVQQVRQTYLERVGRAANIGSSETLVDDHRIQALTALGDVEASVERADPGTRAEVDELVTSTREEVSHHVW